MENDNEKIEIPDSILENIKPFFFKDEDYFTACTDIKDIFESISWLSEFSKKAKYSNLDEIESAMIEMEIFFIDHIDYHIKSLKENIKSALQEIAERQDNLI